VSSVPERLERAPFQTREDAFGIRGAVWTSTSLKLPSGLDFESYEHVLWALGKVRDTSAWALGDAVNFGEARYGERYAHPIEASGRAKKTLINFASVARKIPQRRRASLSWSVHAEVASLPPKKRDRWLDRLEQHPLTVEELRGALGKGGRNVPISGTSSAACPCCGSPISPGTIVRDEHCPVHGRTSLEREVAGIAYLRCGCMKGGWTLAETKP